MGAVNGWSLWQDCGEERRLLIPAESASIFLLRSQNTACWWKRRSSERREAVQGLRPLTIRPGYFSTLIHSETSLGVLGCPGCSHFCQCLLSSSRAERSWGGWEISVLSRKNREQWMCVSVCFSWWAVCGSTARQMGGLMGLASVSVSVNPDKATDTSQTEKSFPSLGSGYILAPPSQALENTLGQLPGRKYLSGTKTWAAQANSLPITTHPGAEGRGQLSLLPWLLLGNQEEVGI